MKRDTKIVLACAAFVPAAILALSTLCSFAIASGASMRWRSLFGFICHGRVERSLALFDIPMPICARCTGIYLGLLAGLAAFWFVRFVSARAMRNVSLVALMPLAIDGLTQLTGLRESTNPLRVATGLIAGLAFGLWILSAVEHRDDAAFTTS